MESLSWSIEFCDRKLLNYNVISFYHNIVCVNVMCDEGLNRYRNQQIPTSLHPFNEDQFRGRSGSDSVSGPRSIGKAAKAVHLFRRRNHWNGEINLAGGFSGTVL